MFIPIHDSPIPRIPIPGIPPIIRFWQKQIKQPIINLQHKQQGEYNMIIMIGTGGIVVITSLLALWHEQHNLELNYAPEKQQKYISYQSSS